MGIDVDFQLWCTLLECGATISRPAYHHKNGSDADTISCQANGTTPTSSHPTPTLFLLTITPHASLVPQPLPPQPSTPPTPLTPPATPPTPHPAPPTPHLGDLGEGAHQQP